MGPQSVKTSKQTNYNPSYFLRKGLSMNLELAILPRLAGEPLGTIRLCSFPAGTEVTDAGAATSGFSISSESGSSCLYRKKCYPFSHLPSSSSDILGSSFLHCLSPDTFTTVLCVSFLISFIARIPPLQFELHKEEFLSNLSIYLFCASL